MYNTQLEVVDVLESEGVLDMGLVVAAVYVHGPPHPGYGLRQLGQCHVGDEP